MTSALVDLVVINVTAFIAGWAAHGWWTKHRRESP